MYSKNDPIYKLTAVKYAHDHNYIQQYQLHFICSFLKYKELFRFYYFIANLIIQFLVEYL